MTPQDLIGKTADELANLLANAQVNLDQKNLDLSQIAAQATTKVAQLNIQLRQVPVQAKIQTDGKNREIAAVEASIGNINAAIAALATPNSN